MLPAATPQPKSIALTTSVIGDVAQYRTAVATPTIAIAPTTVRSRPNLAPKRALSGEAIPIITTGTVVRNDAYTSVTSRSCTTWGSTGPTDAMPMRRLRARTKIAGPRTAAGRCGRETEAAAV